MRLGRAFVAGHRKMMVSAIVRRLEQSGEAMMGIDASNPQLSRDLLFYWVNRLRVFLKSIPRTS